MKTLVPVSSLVVDLHIEIGRHMWFVILEFLNSLSKSVGALCGGYGLCIAISTAMNRKYQSAMFSFGSRCP